ncbi:sugar ABC transporter ATP-binding protein [Faecalicatena sp. AGMB00832]|uniref:Sugar ABC transporter ATP-binding protein n=1 Tax=Faecalicatena faecalis TaxID=2726362 RepID=A0ABS6CY36_9FIRM|nr:MULTISPECIES: sugar ABC transporter ATP-binding protein [Faecalicatena]MBU3874233.1 sugar ABC transporter ATP-binding protein [Faecalicatena faecalis]MCI6465313.1 sugar ABC transporter ATP-binding protein [Faecalicatena sp.]MDY5617525.1 sugar ABC transporter ATP-binding protein [Lachnospiraceae bacterium]
MQDEIMLKLEHVVKSFPGVKAVDDVSLEVKKGEIHALLGHNGAGKSTLVKIISGAYVKDSGTVTLDSEEINLTSPQAGIKKGIGMVYQELDLIPDLSGDENIFLGQNKFRNRFGLIDAQSRRREAERIIQNFDIDIDLSLPVRKLGVSKQQVIAIAKAISREAKVVIFDEPTAALNNAEAECLFGIMKKLAGQGVSIIWITHRLDEIFETADRVTLMREGKWITTKEIGQITMKEIVTELTGVTEEEQISTVNISNKTDEKLISCQNISAQKLFQNISFDLYRGEVLGITGLIGCGSTEIAKALFAVNKLSGGEIYIKGKKIEHFTPKTAAQKGIAYISEDRKMEGLNLKGSVQNNIVLTMSKEWSKLGFLNQKKEKESAKEMVETLDIRISDLSQTVNTLSGGNQQKIVLAKWLLKNAEVFVMCEPTRGIDIGAKREIHKIIRQLAKEGKAVLVVSSEVEEIIDTCDRVIILYDGRVKGELLSKDCAKKKMLDTMYGI